MGGRFTYGANRLQDNSLAVEVREGQTREGQSRTPSKVRGFSWKTSGGGRRGKGREGGERRERRERRERGERGMRRGKEEEREKVVREEKEQDQVELLEGPVTILSQDSQQ